MRAAKASFSRSVFSDLVSSENLHGLVSFANACKSLSRTSTLVFRTRFHENRVKLFLKRSVIKTRCGNIRSFFFHVSKCRRILFLFFFEKRYKRIIGTLENGIIFSGYPILIFRSVYVHADVQITNSSAKFTSRRSAGNGKKHFRRPEKRDNLMGRAKVGTGEIVPPRPKLVLFGQGRTN